MEVRTCAVVNVCAMACMWRSEDNLVGLVSPSTVVWVPEHGAQVVRLAWRVVPTETSRRPLE